MNKKKKNSGGEGLALAGLVGVGLGALGTWIWSKIKEEDQEKEQEKNLQILKQEIATKNQEMAREKKSNAEEQKEKDTTDSDNLMENPNFFCPISNVLMDDPVIITKCGHTFQKESLEAWFKKKKSCPLCVVEVVAETDVKPNYTMKAIVSDLKKKL